MVTEIDANSKKLAAHFVASLNETPLCMVTPTSPTSDDPAVEVISSPMEELDESPNVPSLTDEISMQPLGLHPLSLPHQQHQLVTFRRLHPPHHKKPFTSIIEIQGLIGRPQKIKNYSATKKN